MRQRHDRLQQFSARRGTTRSEICIYDRDFQELYNLHLATVSLAAAGMFFTPFLPGQFDV